MSGKFLLSSIAILFSFNVFAETNPTEQASNVCPLIFSSGNVFENVLPIERFDFIIEPLETNLDWADFAKAFRAMVIQQIYKSNNNLSQTARLVGMAMASMSKNLENVGLISSLPGILQNYEVNVNRGIDLAKSVEQLKEKFLMAQSQDFSNVTFVIPSGYSLNDFIFSYRIEILKQAMRHKENMAAALELLGMQREEIMYKAWEKREEAKALPNGFPIPLVRPDIRFDFKGSLESLKARYRQIRDGTPKAVASKVAAPKPGQVSQRFGSLATCSS